MTTELVEITKCDVFTPDEICKQMTELLLLHSSKNDKKTLLEPSVGTGNLLKFINFDNYEIIDVHEIKKQYLDELPFVNKNIQKHHDDFLMSSIDKKYDDIILNPPYLKIQDLPSKYREYLQNNWKLKGSIDIYYIFLLKCLEQLKENGTMIAITPNSYLYTKSAKTLRKIMFDNRYVKEIVDFKSKKVFKNISVYCCITVFTKDKKDSFIYNGELISYDIVCNTNNKEYSIFERNTTDNKEHVNDEEKKEKTLGDIAIIKNGIATLRDKIYIHEEKKFKEPCWQKVTNSKEIKYIIYPYKNGKIIEETLFERLNPRTFQYLLENKDELDKRDNGNKDYAAWYAYGRTQSLLKPLSKHAIYIPTLIDPNNMCIEIKDSTLWWNCLCIEIKDEYKDEYTLEKIKEVILQNKNYIDSSCSKRGSGWINLNTTILKKISM